MSKNKEKSELALREKDEIKRNEGEHIRPGIRYSPRVDIYETEQAISLIADLPGVAEEDLDIDLDDRSLTITGQVKEPDSHRHSVYTEYGIGGFNRSFKLGDSIDRSKINASLKDGVLTLILPKADRLKPRKIEITS